MANTLRHKFTDLPTRGFGLVDKGFAYEVTAARPHVNKDGAASMVVEWRGQCADCGQAFDFSTGASVWNLPRRCARDAKGKGRGAVKPFGMSAAEFVILQRRRNPIYALLLARIDATEGEAREELEGLRDAWDMLDLL